MQERRNLRGGYEKNKALFRPSMELRQVFEEGGGKITPTPEDASLLHNTSKGNRNCCQKDSKGGMGED